MSARRISSVHREAWTGARAIPTLAPTAISSPSRRNGCDAAVREPVGVLRRAQAHLNHGELVPADPRDGVALAHRVGEAAGDGADKLDTRKNPMI